MNKKASRFLKRSGLSPSPLGLGLKRKRKDDVTIYSSQKRNQRNESLDKHFVDFLILRGFKEKKILSLIKKLTVSEDSSRFIDQFIRRHFPELHIQITDQMIDFRYRFSAQFKMYIRKQPKSSFTHQMRVLGFCPICRIECEKNELDTHLVQKHPQIMRFTTLFKRGAL